MPRGKFRWTQEGDDAAILAQAILSGTVSNNLPSFKEFYDPESPGPGAAIGEKFDYHLPKGRRNLHNNWKKLFHKITVELPKQPSPK